MKNKPTLCVVMPAFNEESTIEEIIRKVIKEETVGRLIVVNDCSTDSTPLILKNFESNNKILLIDDYGHHPAEISAVVETIKGSLLDKRLVMVFQPHRYTRLRDLLDEFAKSLSTVDRLILLEVYFVNDLIDSRQF